MTESATNEYCGPIVLGLPNIIGINTQNTIDSYFEGHNVVYVHKGRTAIRIACELLGLGPYSDVLAPSYTCGSEIDALLSSGSSVILYRIDKTASIDISDLESRITKRTKAVYVTHYFGFPHSLENIKKICAKYNLALIEDCALALFSGQDDQMMGTTGDIAIFSLPKTLPVPDGGILLTGNMVARKKTSSLSPPQWLDIFTATLPLLKTTLVRRLSLNPSLNRLYRELANRKQSCSKNNDAPNIQVRNDMPQDYYYNDLYSNKDISSITRRLINTFDPNKIKEKRRHNYKVLEAMLERHPSVTPLYKKLPDQVCPLYFPVHVEKRDAMVQKLSQQQIDARPWWRGFHKSLPWSEFPDACYLKDNIMALPVHQYLSEAAIEYMAKCVTNFASKKQ